MGCTASLPGVVGKKKKKRNIIPQVAIFAPLSMHHLIPCRQSHLFLQRTLDLGLIPKHVAHTITSLRNHIASAVEDFITPGPGPGPGGSAAVDHLHRLLQDYLPLLIPLAKKEHGLQNSVEFKWKSASDCKQDMCVSNSWFELLSILQMMANLTLTQANLKIIPKQSSSSSSGEALVSAENMSEAVELLIKGAGYLDFCIRDVMVRLPPEITSKLPEVSHKGVMEATINQALAQGTEIQLGLAVGSQNATLSVKRRLACELVSYLGQAHYCLSINGVSSCGDVKKHLLFIKWKYLEGKAAAYYYHGLMMDKGSETSCHINALSCFLAAEQVLSESKKACLSFCLADPVTRAPPPWGVMKHLVKKIHETASKKFQMHGYLLDQDKDLGSSVPELPEFELSLRPEEYELPPVLESSWDTDKWPNNIRAGEPKTPLKLKQHLLKDTQEEEEEEELDEVHTGTDI